ncbi:dTMP kinase [Psychromicrobium xiongbiense]|uniref:dTMP kinase n=1 Tax=Psychromicrobium xiongbiense TaxID=3051184 RepID=UPI0025557752|nr:dTMP kinase [Psychromicrobium sp. YIM S02556]
MSLDLPGNTFPPAGAAAAPGLFIAFEGGDGAGKSTQSRLVVEKLQALGHTVIPTREPGGTDLGEKIRSLVLDHGHGPVDARTEALLFAASRAAHVAQVIRPALASGGIVVCDRYIDSSAAYQGTGRGLGEEAVLRLNGWATEGLHPDLTVLLDVAPSSGRARNSLRDAVQGADRLESESEEFHAAIRQAFLHLARAVPERYLVLDAGLPVEQLHAAILARVQRLLEQVLPGGAQ